MEIRIFGPGCVRCKMLEERTREALTALGPRKVGIIQPYGEDHGARHMKYVREFGSEPTGVVGLAATLLELGKVSLDQVYASARSLMDAHPETDTIHIYCPHLATAGVTDRIERDFGVTVVASLQAIVWNAMRHAGIDDRVAGFGRLLAEF